MPQDLPQSVITTESVGRCKQASMKNLRDKFKQNVNLVEPLYKKARINSRVKSKTISGLVNVNSHTKLCSNGLNVKHKVVENYNVIDFEDSKDFERTLPGACIYNVSDKKVQNSNSKLNTESKRFRCKSKSEKFIGRKSKCVGDKIKVNMEENDLNSKAVQAEQSLNISHKAQDTWLRVFPAVQLPGESALSVILRCVVCQLGLATFLVLWTITWVFIINFFEGPFEAEVSRVFENEQNQLVIDLATELRQAGAQNFPNDGVVGDLQ
ncbi:hypothetical protein evm_009057 [Chilo suppressalis]|nr:hypothetical protein evm_009057 [Chilo suppressalis]